MSGSIWTQRQCPNSGSRVLPHGFSRLDPAAVATRVQLAPDEIDFLRQGLARLPHTDDEHRPVTLDLNGQVVIRAMGPGAPHPTELVLSRSQVSGTPLAICTNRKFLASALAMGFRDLGIVGVNGPVLCDDGERKYLWCLLDPQALIQPDEQAIRVESVAAGASQPVPKPRRSTSSPRPRSTIPLSKNANETNGRHVAADTTSNGQPAAASPIEQAEALRGALREALARTGELIASLRRQRKQTRLMKTTLDSLKELQRVAG